MKLTLSFRSAVVANEVDLTTKQAVNLITPRGFYPYPKLPLGQPMASLDLRTAEGVEETLVFNDLSVKTELDELGYLHSHVTLDFTQDLFWVSLLQGMFPDVVFEESEDVEDFFYRFLENPKDFLEICNPQAAEVVKGWHALGQGMDEAAVGLIASRRATFLKEYVPRRYSPAFFSLSTLSGFRFFRDSDIDLYSGRNSEPIHCALLNPNWFEGVSSVGPFAGCNPEFYYFSVFFQLIGATVSDREVGVADELRTTLNHYPSVAAIHPDFYLELTHAPQVNTYCKELNAYA